MKNSNRNKMKNSLSIFVIALLAMILFGSGIRANNVTETMLQIKVAVEGLYFENNGYSAKDFEATVYLRNVEPPFEIAGFATGYIDRMSLKGSFIFKGVETGQYYIVLKSENTIETWSKKGGELIVNNMKKMYDFTSGIDKAYGDNMKQSGKLASIYTGDVNQDGIVNETDVDLVMKRMLNPEKGIFPEDLNGDGMVDKFDYGIVTYNAKLQVRAITPFSDFRASDGSDVPMITVQIKTAIEGLININPAKGYMTKDPLVTVYLRDANAPYKVVGMADGFINKNTFKGTFQFPIVVLGNYYIVIKSNNSIETWSRKGGEQIVSDRKIFYDFTTGKDKAFGDNMLLNGNYSCIYTGDIDQNGFVDKTDVNLVIQDMGKIKGDVPTDLNGDQLVTESDYNIVYSNFLKNVQAITPMNDLNSFTETKESFTLNQNIPNPFNPSTQISFNVPNTSNVNLSIYDVSGREVAQLVNTVLAPGNYTYVWNASAYASGIYFYKITVNGVVQTMKMQLIK